MLLHYLTNTLSLLCLQTKVIPFILSTIAHLINFINGTSLSYLLFGYAHLTFPFLPYFHDILRNAILLEHIHS